MQHPSLAKSECAPHGEWISTQVRLGRNAMAIYQDLVDQFGFAAKYNSVKRWVRRLKGKDPEQYDRLEYPPGEEAQVDYGEGAPTLTERGKYRKPRLFVMTMKHSRRTFRKVVWKSSQEEWAKLHEEAFRYFGGTVRYVVLDNLKEGVLRPDIYEPGLNPVFQAMLAHYGVVADPARVGDSNRKGTVEHAVGHTQGTALKGRKFESLEAQNAFLAHWEERWAARRIHGRLKRQVEELFQEEKPHLGPLPREPFRYFGQEMRTVADDGLIQVGRAYYAALPMRIGSRVIVRIYADEIEIIDPVRMETVRRHGKSTRPGEVKMAEGDRIYNPSRQTEDLSARAERIGPQTGQMCRQWFEAEGRSGQRRVYGVIGLARKHTAVHIEAAAGEALARGLMSFQAFKRLLESLAEKRPAPETAVPQVQQNHPLIRAGEEYAAFFARHARGAAEPAVPVAGPPEAKTGPGLRAGFLRREDLSQVWQRASWRKVIEVFGLETDERRDRRPGEIWVRSPFTNERTASLHMDEHANVYKDFSSGLGGGILTFCQELLKRRGTALNAYEVGRWMIREGISSADGPPLGRPPLPRPPTGPSAENPPLDVDLRRHLRWDHPEWRRRQISPGTCRYLGCGFLPERGDGRNGSPLNGRLVFQIRGVREETAGLRPVIVSHAGRALTREEAETRGKYWSFPFRKGWELYNQDLLLLDAEARRQAQEHGLLVVEGFFDTAALVEAGCRNVVALMGATLSDEQADRLAWLRERLDFPLVRLFLDRDAAGQAGSRRAAEKLAARDVAVSRFDWEQWVAWPGHPAGPIPEPGQDPGSLGIVPLQWLRQRRLI